MSKKRKVYSPEFKAKLVLEVLEGIDTVNQIASKYEVQPLNLRNWKKQFLENMSLAFERETCPWGIKVLWLKSRSCPLRVQRRDRRIKKRQRYTSKESGELDSRKGLFRGKCLGSDRYFIHLVLNIYPHSKERKVLLDTKLKLSINKQCKLLQINKSSLYYQPKKPFSTNKEINFLDAINNIYSNFPSYGYRRITKQLQRDGFNVGKKLVKKAMRYMGIEALYPKPKTTVGNKEHKKYPYLLKEFRNDAGQVIIDKVNKVWSTDITYIKLETGFVYLAAIIDWHSKKILSWKLSNTMDNSLVTSVLKEALIVYPKPEIFNTDQGSQYTSKEHTNILKRHSIKISMDGKGRATDNICIERFWRSIKYEEIYLNEYKNMKVLKKSIGKYINNYNQKRLHSAIDYETPNAPQEYFLASSRQVYFQAINNSNSKGDKKLPKVS